MQGHMRRMDVPAGLGRLLGWDGWMSDRRDGVWERILNGRGEGKEGWAAWKCGVWRCRVGIGMGWDEVAVA